jgi:hypothetical protein
VGVLFSIETISFVVQKLFNFMKSHFSIFLLVAGLLGFYWWSQVGHGVWSFWCVLGFSLPLFYQGFFHWYLLMKLACSSPFWRCLYLVLDESNIGFIKWVRQCSFPFYFVEQFRESWY